MDVGIRFVTGWVLALKVNAAATVMILMDSAFDILGKYLKTDMLWSFYHLKERAIFPIKFKILKITHSVFNFQTGYGNLGFNNNGAHTFNYKTTLLREHTVYNNVITNKQYPMNTDCK